MATYGERLKNSRTYEETVMPHVCRALLLCSLSIPLLVALSRLHIIHISDNTLYIICFSLLLSLIAPFFMLKSSLPTAFIKYYTSIALTITVSMLALIPEVDIRMGYLIGVAVAMVFLDTRLMIIEAVLSYLVMNISLFMIAARWLLTTNSRLPSFNAIFAIYKSHVEATTIEFLLLLPPFFIACIMARRHIISEEELYVELSTEEERYRLAFEESDDLIFDYEYDTDRLTYYGSLLEKDSDNSVKHIVDQAFEKLSRGELVYSEDVGDIIKLLNGETSDSLSVRLCGREAGEYLWIRVEGRIVWKGDKKVRVVGKMTDISKEREKEADFLENAKKDPATGFFTWEIGEKLIDMLTESQDAGLYYLFFKILNLQDITDEYGSFFSDAIISRVAETSQAVLTSEDYLFRLNNDTFIAIITDLDEDLIGMIHSSLEHSLENIYVGDEEDDGLDYIVRFIRDKDELLKIIEGEDSSTVVPVKKTGNIDYDAVSFTFNILEHSKDFSTSMMLLLEHIANMFNIVNIYIMERDDTPGLEICLYDFSSVPGGAKFEPGERRESDTGELQMTYDFLANKEYIIMNSSFLAHYSNDTRNRIMGNHTSHLVIPILSAGEIYGTVDYEHLNTDYEWPERTVNTLLEVTRCMSTYLLRDRADSASRAKSDFLASVSHEIRTPLNAISGFSELMLAREELDSESRRYATGIKGSADNLLAVISGILDFSKIESGKVEILHDHFRISETIADLYRMTEISVKEKGLDYNISFEKNVPDGLVGDEQRIKQVLLNLVSNAIKFTHDGGIDLNLSFIMEENEKQGMLLASVKDTGEGIKEDEINLIFESFQYGDKARNKSTRGVGLGLTICKDLLHMMKGDISCESTQGKGSVFSISVPVEVFDDSPASFDEGYSEIMPEEVFHLPFICPRAKVLIVDDNKVNLDVAKGLIGQYHPQITTAMSGDEALNIYFAEHDFDIIFMDHMMPKMDGIECVNHLRRLNVPGAADVPVVALTANAVKGARKLFLTSGMDDYISKPIKLTTLAEVMARWIPDKYKEVPVWDNSWDDPSKKDRKVPADTAQTSELYDFSKLKEINSDVAITNVGGSKEVYRELLATFYDSDSMSEANGYYNDRDLENYRITVHGLKSSARYIGADKLSEKAKELEDYAKNGDWSSIDREHPVLLPMYAEVADSIRDYLGEADDSASEPSGSSELMKDDLVKKLDELADYLINLELDEAAECAASLKKVSTGDEETDVDLGDVIKMIENFDFEDAETNLKILKDRVLGLDS
ncbi:MAG: response regulator [Lachnospiraceae bacterium]|nr:response regulator [Lachnospiraceae bacterium]